MSTITDDDNPVTREAIVVTRYCSFCGQSMRADQAHRCFFTEAYANTIAADRASVAESARLDAQERQARVVAMRPDTRPEHIREWERRQQEAVKLARANKAKGQCPLCGKTPRTIHDPVDDERTFLPIDPHLGTHWCVRPLSEKEKAFAAEFNRQQAPAKKALSEVEALREQVAVLTAALLEDDGEEDEPKRRKLRERLSWKGDR